MWELVWLQGRGPEGVREPTCVMGFHSVGLVQSLLRPESPLPWGPRMVLGQVPVARLPPGPSHGAILGGASQISECFLSSRPVPQSLAFHQGKACLGPKGSFFGSS